jgi:hypothetical protein
LKRSKVLDEAWRKQEIAATIARNRTGGTMFQRIRARLTFANVVSALALFVALATGGAYAANTITSDDIVDGQVMRQDIAQSAVASGKIQDGTVSAQDLKSNVITSSSIAPGQVGSGDLADAAVTRRKLDLLAYDEVPDEQTFACSTSWQDLGGPSVTVDVPSNALVALYAQVDGTYTADVAGGASVGIVEATEFPQPAEILRFESPTWKTMWTAPLALGAANKAQAGSIVFPAGAGTKTFTLRYKSNGCAPADTASFRNRRLWATVIK